MEEKEIIYENGTKVVFGKNGACVGYVGPLREHTLIFNPKDTNQSAILLTGTSQIDLRKIDFSAIENIEINHVRYIREDLIK